MRVLEQLEPKTVFHYFEEICKIPHGSGNMDQISAYCVEFAQKHGLEYVQDHMKNVIIIKEAAPGYEDRDPVIIQGHLDMVCEKQPGKEKDFMTEGLEICTDGKKIWADGTTLGGDDGIAVAYALALLEAEDLKHPRLEIVLTVDEETGLYGAEAIDLSMLKGRKLINIDSEDEGIFTVGCAGGLTLECTIPVITEKKQGMLGTLEITGLLGGHSGVEIDKGRANANVLLGRVLYELNKEVPVEIISMEGGLKDNAIPRYAQATVLFEENRLEQIREIIEKQERIFRNEFHAGDPDVTIQMTAEGTGEAEAADQTSKNALLHTLLNIPNGVQDYSMDIRGLVETSLNMGIMKFAGKELTLSFAIRSSVGTAKYHLRDKVQLFVEMLGGTAEAHGDYPGWEYRPDSELRERFVKVYEEMYGRSPVVETIHAGLECGMFSQKISDLDCISFGPDMRGVHTFEETLDVGSVKRCWEFLCRVLES